MQIDETNFQDPIREDKKHISDNLVGIFDRAYAFSLRRNESNIIYFQFSPHEIEIIFSINSATI